METKNKYRLARMLLACARELAAAKINDLQRRMIEYSESLRQHGLDFGTAFNWDSYGRAYFPVSRTIRDIYAPWSIVDALKKLGYSITNYREGKAIKTIEVRDGKKTMTKNIGKILKNEVHDESLYKLFVNRLGTTSKQDNRKFMVCITHNAEDVGAMSTGRNWTSCMHLPDYDNEDEGGEYHYTALNQVQYGGMCAYLIDPNDMVVDNPYARIAIKRFENGKGGFIYKAENRVYGDEDLADECGFMGIVDKELDRANKITMNGYGTYKTTDNLSYSDSKTRELSIYDSEDPFTTLDISDFKKYVDEKMDNDGDSEWLVNAVEKYISKNKANASEVVKWISRSFYNEVPFEFFDRHADMADWNSVSDHLFSIGYNCKSGKPTGLEDYMKFLERHKNRIWWDAVLCNLTGNGYSTYDSPWKNDIMNRFHDCIEAEKAEREKDPIDYDLNWARKAMDIGSEIPELKRWDIDDYSYLDGTSNIIYSMDFDMASLFDCTKNTDVVKDALRSAKFSMIEEAQSFTFENRLGISAIEFLEKARNDELSGAVKNEWENRLRGISDFHVSVQMLVIIKQDTDMMNARDCLQIECVISCNGQTAYDKSEIVKTQTEAVETLERIMRDCAKRLPA